METNDLILYGAIGVVGYFAYQAYQNSQAAIAVPAPIYVTIPNPVNNTTATIPVSSSAPVATSNGTVTPIVQPPATIPLISIPVSSNAATSTVVSVTNPKGPIATAEVSLLHSPYPTQFVNGIQQGYAPMFAFVKSGNGWNGEVTNAPPNAPISMQSADGQSMIPIGISTDSNGNADLFLNVQPSSYWTVGPLYGIATIK